MLKIHYENKCSLESLQTVLWGTISNLAVLKSVREDIRMTIFSTTYHIHCSLLWRTHEPNKKKWSWVRKQLPKCSPLTPWTDRKNRHMCGLLAYPKKGTTALDIYSYISIDLALMDQKSWLKFYLQFQFQISAVKTLRLIHSFQ